MVLKDPSWSSVMVQQMVPPTYQVGTVSGRVQHNATASLLGSDAGADLIVSPQGARAQKIEDLVVSKLWHPQKHISYSYSNLCKVVKPRELHQRLRSPYSSTIKQRSRDLH